MIRYSNDLELSEIQRQFYNNTTLLKHTLTNGHLGQAFLYAMELERIARALQVRLNDIRFPPKK